MYVIIKYRPLLKPWKVETIFEMNVAYVNRNGVDLEIMFRPTPTDLKTKKIKVLRIVDSIIESDRYNRMNGRFK